MNLTITVYEDTGRFYSDATVNVPADTQMWDENFRQLIRDNLPATYEDGFVTVVGDGENFVNCLFQMNDLILNT